MSVNLHTYSVLKTTLEGRENVLRFIDKETESQRGRVISNFTQLINGLTSIPTHISARLHRHWPSHSLTPHPDSPV